MIPVNKIASCRHELQRKTAKTSVNSASWDKAHRWVRDRLSSQAFKTYLVYVEVMGATSRARRMVPKRLLASRRGVSGRTIYNHNREMIRAGVLRLQIHKISHKRNAPNTYILLGIDGRDLDFSMEKNFHEKPLQNLKLTTPPRVARVENNFPAMRRLYEQNGRLWKLLRRVADAKAHRLHKAEERTRMAMEASIGSPRYYPKPTEAEEQHNRDEALFYWRSMKAKGQPVYYLQCPHWARQVIDIEGII
jgi:hypothetical protein